VLLQDQEKVAINFVHYDSSSEQVFYSAKGFNHYSLIKNITENHNNFAVKSMVRIDEKYFGIAVSGFYGLFLDPLSNVNAYSEWDLCFEKHKSPSSSEFAYLHTGLRAKSIDYDFERKSLVVATNMGLFLNNLNSEKELLLNGVSFFAEKVFWHEGFIYALETKGDLYTIDEMGSFTLLNPALGLRKQDIKRVKKIDNELFIITSRAIHKYDLRNKKNQIIDLEIRYATFLDVEKVNGQLYILTREGLIKLAEKESSTKSDPAKFLLNYIAVNGKKTIGQTTFKLAHDENNIRVNFSVIDFGKSFANKVFYRLNGKDWVEINKDTRTLLFSSLSPGSFLLEFKIDGSKAAEKIAFEIRPPYWQTWWFYLTFVLLVVGVVFVVFRWRIRNDLKKIALLNEKIQLEQSLNKSILTAVKSQMNPHFFYNALNTIQAFIYTNDNKTANSYLAKFSKLTRMVLEMSERDTITLAEEFKALELYLELEKMRFQKNFHYTLNTETIDSPTMIEIPPMLIQPYLENAIKHGLLHREGERKLEVSFSLKSNNQLEVVIEDNGVGREKSAEINQMKKEKHSTCSSEANQKRLEILNVHNNEMSAIEIQDKYDDTGVALGTRVVLNIKTN
jgi:hypothetical protein